MRIDVAARTMAVGGGVALLGVALLGAFVWMVPGAATRENHAACAALRSQPPAPAMCPGGRPCTLPIPAPDITAVDRDGRPVKLSDFRGKVVLVDFWGSWCHFCKFEKPALAALASDLGGKDFEVVTLASDRDWSDVDDALQDALGKTDAPFEVLLDAPDGDGSIGRGAASWGIVKVPESALIDRNGNVRAYFGNRRDWQSPVAETCLRSLIDE